MASCEHGHSPSHLCSLCNNQREKAQYGNLQAGEVGTSLKGRTRVNIYKDPSDGIEAKSKEENEKKLDKFVGNSFLHVKKEAEKIAKLEKKGKSDEEQ